MSTIVLVGNPVDGFTAYGPFDDPEDAVEWADSWTDEQWNTMTLEPPEEAS